MEAMINKFANNNELSKLPANEKNKNNNYLTYCKFL